MSDAMMFPETIEEFIDQYKFIDTDQIYTNGSELIQVFRVMQWVEHERALDAEPIRRGQWNKEEDTLFRLCVYKCSLCGGEVLSEAYLFKYCPYCGAKMDEVENNGEMDKT